MERMLSRLLRRRPVSSSSEVNRLTSPSDNRRRTVSSMIGARHVSSHRSPRSRGFWLVLVKEPDIGVQAMPLDSADHVLAEQEQPRLIIELKASLADGSSGPEAKSLGTRVANAVK